MKTLWISSDTGFTGIILENISFVFCNKAEKTINLVIDHQTVQLSYTEEKAFDDIVRILENHFSPTL